MNRGHFCADAWFKKVGTNVFKGNLIQTLLEDRHVDLNKWIFIPIQIDPTSNYPWPSQPTWLVHQRLQVIDRPVYTLRVPCVSCSPPGDSYIVGASPNSQTREDFHICLDLNTRQNYKLASTSTSLLMIWFRRTSSVPVDYVKCRPSLITRGYIWGL